MHTEINDNYLGNVTEAARLGNLQIKINDIEIVNNTISDFQIDFDKELKGVITFIDNSGISQDAPLTYATISILYTDFENTTFDYSYIITKIATTRYKEGTIKHTCYFEDIYLNVLKNYYVSKSFQNKNILEIVKDVFDELDIKAEIAIGDETFNNESLKVYDYFVIPKNISFWEFIKKHLLLENVEYYFDKDGFHIITKDDLGGNILVNTELKEYKFSNNKETLATNILEFSGISSNKESVDNMPSSNINIFDINSLKYDPEFIDFNKVYEYEKMNDYIGYGNITPDQIYISGIREIDNIFENFLGNEKDKNYRDYLMDNQKYQIVLHGTNNLKMYQKIRVVVEMGKFNQDDLVDKTFTGDFIIKKVTDRIISGVFVQIIEIHTSDYGKGE